MSGTPEHPGIAGAPGDAGSDPFLAARLDTLALSGVSPTSPPPEFLAAVARRRGRERRAPTLLVGLAIAAAVVLAGLAYRAASPPAPEELTGGGPVLAANNPNVEARLQVLRDPGAEVIRLPGVARSGGSPITEIRAGYSAAILRDERALSVR